MTGPGTFLLCLGFGIILSKNSTPQKLFLRGISMFGIQIILNFFRYLLPHFIVFQYLNMPKIMQEGIDFFFYSDILPFAGFTFLFFAFVKKYNISNLLILIFGLFCTSAQMLIPQVEFQNNILRFLSGYFLYVDDTSFFPFISWIIYPIIGYLLGQKLIQTENKTTFYLQIGLASLFIFILANSFLYLTNSINKDYYLFMETGFRMDLDTTIIVSSVIGIYTCLIYLISLLIKNEFLQNIITSISKNINSIYCIHWVLVKFLWVFVIISSVKIEYFNIFFIGIIIFALSAFFAQLRKSYTIANK